MENYVILGAVALIVAVGAWSTVKHFKGEGGCCGGGGYKPKKKRQTGVRYQKVFSVEGMHCEHCRIRVEEVVNDMDGIVGKVDLKRGELVVSYAADVDDETVRTRLERVGYTVTDISPSLPKNGNV